MWTWCAVYLGIWFEFLSFLMIKLSIFAMLVTVKGNTWPVAVLCLGEFFCVTKRERLHTKVAVPNHPCTWIWGTCSWNLAAWTCSIQPVCVHVHYLRIISLFLQCGQQSICYSRRTYYYLLLGLTMTTSLHHTRHTADTSGNKCRANLCQRWLDHCLNN